MNAQHKSSFYKFVGGRAWGRQVWPPKFQVEGGGGAGGPGEWGGGGGGGGEHATFGPSLDPKY